MNNYTKVYHNAIDKIFCKHLIDKFEENTNQQEKYQKGAMSFTQLDLGKYENWKEESGYLKQSLLNVVSQYANELNIGILILVSCKSILIRPFLNFIIACK